MDRAHSFQLQYYEYIPLRISSFSSCRTFSRIRNQGLNHIWKENSEHYSIKWSISDGLGKRTVSVRTRRKAFALARYVQFWENILPPNNINLAYRFYLSFCFPSLYLDRAIFQITSCTFLSYECFVRGWPFVVWSEKEELERIIKQVGPFFWGQNKSPGN